MAVADSTDRKWNRRIHVTSSPLAETLSWQDKITCKTRSDWPIFGFVSEIVRYVHERLAVCAYSGYDLCHPG